MTDRELMQQALEALELYQSKSSVQMFDDAVKVLRERLTQLEQEPVAWMHPSWIDPDTRGWSNDSFSAKHIAGWVPVYTAPRQWQGLTDEELREAYLAIRGNEWCLGGISDAKSFYETIEAALKDKNA